MFSNGYFEATAAHNRNTTPQICKQWGLLPLDLRFPLSMKIHQAPEYPRIFAVTTNNQKYISTGKTELSSLPFFRKYNALSQINRETDKSRRTCLVNNIVVKSRSSLRCVKTRTIHLDRHRSCTKRRKFTAIGHFARITA